MKDYQKYIRLVVGALVAFLVVFGASWLFPTPEWLLGATAFILVLASFLIIAIDWLYARRNALPAPIQQRRPRSKSRRPDKSPFKNRWAIVIGINEYRNVKSLEYCSNDAWDLSEKLHETLGIPTENIFRLSDKKEAKKGKQKNSGENETEHKPGRSEIFDLLSKLHGKIKADDLLLFFFSGHGLRDPNDQQDYLLPLRAFPNALKQTGIRVDDLAEELQSTGCRNVVLFLDACREDLLGARGISAHLGQQSRDTLRRKGIVTFFSCDPNEQSYEISKLGHGSFTHCLLEALANRECITAQDLDKFLRKQVPDVNKRNNKPLQFPYSVIEPAEKQQMPILFSDKKIKSSRDDFKDLKKQLGVIYNDEAQKFPKAYFSQTIAYLDELKGRTTSDEDGRKLTHIRELCAGSLTVSAFKVAWDGAEQQRATVGVLRGAKPRRRKSEKQETVH